MRVETYDVPGGGRAACVVQGPFVLSVQWCPVSQTRMPRPTMFTCFQDRSGKALQWRSVAYAGGGA